jgi:large repetitive protein
VICDNGIPSLCDTAFVNVLIVPTVANIAPIANTDDTTTTSTKSVVIAVLHNDTDPNSDPIHTTAVTVQPLHGTATKNADGTITYVPNVTYNGVDSFQYQICDSSIYLPHVLCSTAWDHITVINQKVNHPPVAVNDTTSTSQGSSVVITVMGNDHDPDAGDIIHVTNVGTPVNGTVVVSPNGTVTYTPNPGFHGTDVFTYTICDNGTPVMCDQAIVYVNVAPVNQPPVANKDVSNTSMNTTVKIPVQGNDLDPDNNPLQTSAIVANPTHGNAIINADGTISYTLQLGYMFRLMEVFVLMLQLLIMIMQQLLLMHQ